MQLSADPSGQATLHYCAKSLFFLSKSWCCGLIKMPHPVCKHCWKVLPKGHAQDFRASHTAHWSSNTHQKRTWSEWLYSSCLNRQTQFKFIKLALKLLSKSHRFLKVWLGYEPNPPTKRALPSKRPCSSLPSVKNKVIQEGPIYILGRGHMGDCKWRDFSRAEKNAYIPSIFIIYTQGEQMPKP